MKTKNEIIEIILNSIEEVNTQNGANLSKNLNEKLFGKGSELDSLGLVNLIVTIEGNINELYETNISIADEKAMSQKHSPFRSIETLADYIFSMLKDEE